MITTNNKFNTMPEQVQENMDNVKKLDEVVSRLNLGTFKGKNLWTNPNPSALFEEQAITNDEFLQPYNMLKIYFINDTVDDLTVQTIMFDLDVNYPVWVTFVAGSRIKRRKVEFNSLQNEIVISDEEVIDVLAGETEEGSNGSLVPLAIIGFVEEVTV